MKKLKIYNLFDTFFRLLVIFLIVYVWVYYIIRTIWLSIVVTAITTLFIDFVLKLFRHKKQKKQSIAFELKQKKENCINSLVFDNDKNVVDFFLTLAKSKHNAQKKSSYIIVFHPDKKIILYPKFMYREFALDDFIEIDNKIQKENANRIIICTKNIATNVYSYVKNKTENYIILDGEKTYDMLFEKYQIYPEQKQFKIQQKTNFKDILRLALNKKRTKGYFLSSVLLLISCFIVPYKLYYCIMSSLLLVLSFVSFSNPTFNTVKVQQLLD